MIDDGSEKVTIIFTGYESDTVLFQYNSSSIEQQNFESNGICPVSIFLKLGLIFGTLVVLLVAFVGILCGVLRAKRRYMSEPDVLSVSKGAKQ